MRLIRNLAFALLLGVTIALPLGSAHPSDAPFRATPLVDFAPNERYLRRFEGLLYTDPATGRSSNDVPAQHDADGRRIASQIVPLDADGRPSPSGKIGVVALGMSNWTMEWCREQFRDLSQCTPDSFLPLARSNPEVNHTTLVLADCAFAGLVAYNWVDNHRNPGAYTLCLTQRLPLWGIAAKQVEVVLWKNADPIRSDNWPPMSPGMVCRVAGALNASNPAVQGSPDACNYERYTGMMARFLKSVFPNVKQLFVHARIYGGYATTTLNPEPYAYETGFATKWLVDSQIRQVATGRIDPVAGDLDYRNGEAPWIAWGPYWWAAGNTPCRNCAESGITWAADDFDPRDGIHPSPHGVAKVARMLQRYYLQSPYSPWFRAH
ncbi:MAG TPA: hypothetical protein VKT83_19405 [bacterium]|nr:hypothetical protein [bacterium]